jgi:predicted TIM-barrel fold metal-dependent hydrolase
VPANTAVFDTWLNWYEPGEQSVYDPTVASMFRPSARWTEGSTLEQLVEDMDEAGYAGGVLTKMNYVVRDPFYPAYSHTDELVHKSCASIASAVERYPDRFVGSYMLDPRGGYAAARHVAIAVDEYAFGSVRIMPSMSLVDANDALCYPIYTAACDRNIPVTVNVGIPGPRKPARHQDPMHLDEVALAFPDLKIVMTHVGNPWVPQAVAMMVRHPNVFMMTSGWSPKYIPAELRDYLKSSRGRHKVMFSSDYPVLGMDRCLEEALGHSAGVLR